MLREVLGRILREWPQATKEPFAQHPIAQMVRQELVQAVSALINPPYHNFKVKGSAGAGNWANIPWLAILNPTITTTTESGVYPVYLFRADGSGVYLSLNQGTTIPEKESGKTNSQKKAEAFANKVRTTVPSLLSWGGKKIELRAKTDLGKSYEQPNIAAKFYSFEHLPSNEELREDLLKLMAFYEQVAPLWQSEQRLSLIEPSTVSLESSFVNLTQIPKPFILLAGISGTGKTRFVREQAAAHRGGDLSNYCSIPVRPDWHEPSDLLGYVSRIGVCQYVVTDLLRFVVAAWKDAVVLTDCALGQCKATAEMTPYWLCLDEMNLAPVEQYFADYLSVLESRRWKDGIYTCGPLLNKDVLTLKELNQDELRNGLGLLGQEFDGLWMYFQAKGIPLPPNLIVAGTVNMDETTHGFSRKVIDRAFTIDFGVFYPNEFDDFFTPKTRPKSMGFPILSHVERADFLAVSADENGEKSVTFLNAINQVLVGTPFELAYRALNELLVSVVCFQPKDAAELQAVWDDFLMSKVLPRIDGDAEKLSGDGNDSLLQSLDRIFSQQLAIIYDAQRIDLLRENIDGSVCMVAARAPQKIKWMQARLEKNGFTSFWP